MKFITTKGISEDKYVSSIVDILIRHPQLFSPIARVFTDYNTVESDDEEIITEYIADLFQSPKLTTPAEKNRQLASCINELYTFNQNKFNSVKSNILERFLYSIGPFSEGLTRKQVYVEPTIKDGQKVIGETAIKCDLVFFDSKHDPLEFVECKSNIRSVMPEVLPYEKAQKRVKKKVEYLNHAYEYLKDTYSTPYIYFACYNHHVTLEERNLQENWGFNYISILTPKEIINMH